MLVNVRGRKRGGGEVAAGVASAVRGRGIEEDVVVERALFESRHNGGGNWVFRGFSFKSGCGNGRDGTGVVCKMSAAPIDMRDRTLLSQGISFKAGDGWAAAVLAGGYSECECGGTCVSEGTCL